jgi:hypothetical protein
MKLLFSALILSVKQCKAQELFVPPSTPGIEELLDELAIDHIIPLNSVAPRRTPTYRYTGTLRLCISSQREKKTS